MALKLNPITGKLDLIGDVSLDTANGLFVKKIGDTMTGNLVLLKDNPAIYFSDSAIGANAAFTTTYMQVVDETSNWLYGIYGGTYLKLGDDGGTTNSTITGDGIIFNFTPDITSTSYSSIATTGILTYRTTSPKVELIETTFNGNFYGENRATAGRWTLVDSGESTSYYEIDSTQFKIAPNSVGSVLFKTSGITFNSGTLGGSLSASNLTASAAGGASNVNGSSWDIIPGDSTGTGTSSVNIWASGGGISGSSASAAAQVLTIGKSTATFADSSAYTLTGGTVFGLKIGSAASTKIGFFGTTPSAQISGSTDVLAGLVTLGLRAVSSNPPLNLGTGSITAGSASFSYGITLSRIAKTADYTLTSLDFFVSFDATSANLTATLPAISGNNRRIYCIKKIDSSANTVTIDGNASETIDGATTYVLSSQYQGVIIMNDTGSNWWILAKI